jgi:hypothetical protein
VSRMPADIRIRLKRRGGRTYRIQLVRIPFTLCDDARRDLEIERQKAAGIKGLRLPAESRRRGK